MTASFARHAARCLFALALMLAGGMAAAALPALDLQVELDPETRRFKAVAELAPPSQDFRFGLHESLQVTAASAGGKAVKAIAAGRDGDVRGWRIRVPEGATQLRI